MINFKFYFRLTKFYIGKASLNLENITNFVEAV